MDIQFDFSLYDSAYFFSQNLVFSDINSTRTDYLSAK